MLNFNVKYKTLNIIIKVQTFAWTEILVSYFMQLASNYAFISVAINIITGIYKTAILYVAHLKFCVKNYT